MNKMEFDDKYVKLGKSETPWAPDDVPQISTSPPDTAGSVSNEIGIVVIFVISAILAITLLFGIAVFIDCRQQRLTKLQKPKRPRKVLRFRLPKINTIPTIPEDEDTFADKMQLPEPEPEPSNFNSPSQIV